MAHRRRGVGAAAALKNNRSAQIPSTKRSTTSYYEAKGAQLQDETLAAAIDTVTNLETELKSFAKTHQSKIQKDPAFRAEFLRMCGPLGIDPLSSEKGLLGGLLGIGQFYYELAVKVAEVCISTRSRNGGIISVSEVRSILSKRGTKFNFTSGNNSSKSFCSEDDIITAVGKLSKLGSGFRTREIGTSTMIVSVPMELDNDHMEVMRIAQSEESSSSSSEQFFGSVTASMVRNEMRWDDARVKRAIDLLLAEGMAWLDLGGNGFEARYWFPSVWKEGMELLEEN